MTACFDMAPDAEKSEQEWRLGKDNGVGNVVVWIQPPEGYYFKSRPGQADLAGKGRTDAAALHASSRT